MSFPLPFPSSSHTHAHTIRHHPKDGIHFPGGKEEDLKGSGAAQGHPSVFEMLKVDKLPR